MKRIILSIFAACTLGFAGNANAGTGGPDTFGYTWIDSNEPNGPAMNWIEIATPAGGTGTLRTAIQCDDCHEANIPLGFNFPFYGVNEDTISISSNGTIYFENTYLGLGNSCMPGTPTYTMSQYKFIAHMWDDLDAASQGGIYTKAFPEYFVIEYYNIVPCCGAGDGDTWQIILFKNGTILMQYKELSNTGLSPTHTVGIQSNPTTGLQYMCDATGTSLASGRVIRFTPPTFSCSTVSQNILPAATSFCAGSSVAISSGLTAIAQTWSTAATTSSISVNTSGAYSIAVLDSNGCTLRDTITVGSNSLPVVSLGPDVTNCGTITLNAGNAGMNYLWSNGATTQTMSTNTPGTYSVIVTNPATTCQGKDTITVGINPVPVVSLGADIAQCAGTTVSLDAGNAGMDFLWSNASTTQTTNVTTAGTYSVIVTDPVTSCVGKDTINVAFNSVTVALGADIVQCGGTATLDAGNAGMNFLWSNTATTQANIVSASGTFSVIVTDPATSCVGKDTINVTINTVPTVTYVNPMDTVCTLNGPVTLSGGSPAGGTYSGTGVASNVFDPNAAGVGTYAITYTYVDANSCTASATQNIVVDVCAGIRDASEMEVNIYPNPATSELYIALGSSAASSIEVMNAVGQIVINEQSLSGTMELNVERLEAGVYFVKITSGNYAQVEKVIIQ